MSDPNSPYLGSYKYRCMIADERVGTPAVRINQRVYEMAKEIGSWWMAEAPASLDPEYGYVRDGEFHRVDVL